MTRSEKETVEVFCRELSQALERITGKKIDITACIEDDPDHTSKGSPCQCVPDSV